MLAERKNQLSGRVPTFSGSDQADEVREVAGVIDDVMAGLSVGRGLDVRRNNELDILDRAAQIRKV